MKYFRITVAVFFVFGCSSNSSKTEQDQLDWSFPHFEKQDDVNPILNPDKELVFTDPISQNQVFWEERNVLNPAAIVKNDTVFMLYRAQDKWGTSRIGLAYSNDGISFMKNKAPVFYPDKDDHKKKNGTSEKLTESPIPLIVYPVILMGLKIQELLLTTKEPNS
jgi:hypothetical protein